MEQVLHVFVGCVFGMFLLLPLLVIYHAKDIKQFILNKLEKVVDNWVGILDNELIETYNHIEEENIMTYLIGERVKLTQQISGEVVGNDTLKIVTHMSVAGGGGRNLIVWSLLASKKGFTDIIIDSPDASYDAQESIAKAISYANELLNHLGVKVRYI